MPAGSLIRRTAGWGYNTEPLKWHSMTDGQCFFCGEVYTKRGMNRHLRSCLPESDGECSACLLRAVGTHREDYWIHMLVRENVTLTKLDSYLREFWLECCNHLSSFQIGGTDYDNENPGIAGSAPQGREQSMGIPLGTALEDGGIDEFGYVYDWGSSTRLTLSVVETGGWELSEIASSSENDVSTGHDGILLVTRNDQPPRECRFCGEPAEYLCQECLMRRGPEAMYCEDCTDEHDCARPRFMPVVNSPRSGVCGYRG